MALQRRDSRESQVQPGGEPPRLKFKRGADGKLEVDEPRPDTHTATEAAERPVTPDDPRTSPFRNIPPVGGA
jgi:hypothetical protein